MVASKEKGVTAKTCRCEDDGLERIFLVLFSWFMFCFEVLYHNFAWFHLIVEVFDMHFDT